MTEGYAHYVPVRLDANSSATLDQLASSCGFTRMQYLELLVKDALRLHGETIRPIFQVESQKTTEIRKCSEVSFKATGEQGCA